MDELLQPLDEERQERISISLSPALVYVERGTDWQFDARVDHARNKKIIWELFGDKHKDTTLTNTGLLKTSLNEKPDIELTVMVTSDQNNEKRAEASVVIVDYGFIAGHVDIDKNATAWVGQTLTAIPNVVNSERDLKYQWKRDGQNIGTNSDIYTVKLEDLFKSITVEVSVIDRHGSMQSPAVFIERQPDALPAVITVQPVSEVNYNQNGTSSPLSVSAHSPDGGTLSYQWFRNDAQIPGAVNRTYTPPTDTAGTFKYHVEIINTIADNGDGGEKISDPLNPVTSTPAFVTVHQSGSAFNPFLVNNETELRYVGRGNENPDPYKTWTLSAHYKQVNNITLNAAVLWVPIGYDAGYNNIGYFSGSYDGNGKNISNLIIESGFSGLGMFTDIRNSVIKNITILNGSIKGSDHIGGIAGSIQESTIENCIFNGSIESTNNESIGGIVGRMTDYSLINNCQFKGTVSGRASIGGIAGSMDFNDKIEKCTVNGNVIGTGIYIGGIAGYGNSGFIENCNFDGEVSGDNRVGGIAGENENGTIRKSNFSGDVKSAGEYVGGIVGVNKGTVENCNVTGDIICDGSYFGGIAGQNERTINNSHFKGTISGDGYLEVGGVAGANDGSASNIKNSSFIGVINSGAENVGGITGNNWGTVENCFSSGSINKNGGNITGGIAGYNSGIIQKCYSTIDIISANNNVGGIAGNNENTIQNCYSTGDIAGTSNIGGIVGENYNIVQYCYSTSSVKGTSHQIAGIVANNTDSATLQYCVALNSLIQGSDGSLNVARITGFNKNVCDNNYARSGLAPLAGTGQDTHDGRDGQSVSPGTIINQYNSQSFWQNTMGFSFTDTWQWNSQTGLPILRGMGTQSHTALK